MRDADLTGANLTSVRLGGADLTGANLTGAVLDDAGIDEDPRLLGARLDDVRVTRLYDGDLVLVGAAALARLQTRAGG